MGVADYSQREHDLHFLGEDPDDDECPECGGDGFVEGPCFEDTCCCVEPHELIVCPTCRNERRTNQ
jgi:hypothetical protein